MIVTKKHEVTLDPKTHIYSHKGIEKVGLTAMLRAHGIGLNKFYTDQGRDEGTMIHLACRYLAEGSLDWDTVDPLIVDRIRGYEKFLNESGFKPEILEEPFYSPSLDLCTMPDQVGLLGTIRAVIELKRGAKAEWHKLQTAGQKIVLADNEVFAQARYSLYLKPNDYRLEAHNDREDEVRFKVLTSAYHAASFYK